ncbi:excalibur calcium-binding domain-containing protein [Paenibacillus sp. FJAT-26967]|uniref:excalibur calcium-binding domain-containing protein n=1 Tax=Paenibacillus sp. FJAT-26967 TaxID=1729690 RepID=UPI00083935FB|nr:excalibur calcium-binding domain-containing protein [Paenibacillus sp. FJAT-26967]
MKKKLAAALAVALFIGIPLGYGNVAEAKAKTYKNCTELNKDYKGGVARSASVKNKGGKTKYKPYVSQELYDANKKSDRDKDLIACEQ